MTVLKTEYLYIFNSVIWKGDSMERRDILSRRIRICRTILVLQLAVELAFGVAVWYFSDAHRHLFNHLWYASLFIQTGLMLIPGKRISEAKEELDTLNHSVEPGYAD